MSAVPWILGSIASSVTIIILNKILFHNYQFHSPIALSIFHFFITTGVLNVFRRLRFFDRVPVSTFDKWFTGLLNALGLFFSNWNLRYNSVGFYQLTKLLVVPFIITIEFFTQKKTYKLNIYFSLSLLLIGVGLFSINDMSVNLFGTVIALLCVSICANSQIRAGLMQKKYNMNGLSIQDMMNIPMIVIGIFWFLLFESYGPNSIFIHTFQTKEVLVIIATGLVSIGVNVFAQGLIGKTSPLTFQVVGHCKSILIFTSGMILFPVSGTKSQLIKQICGLSIAMTGVILYSLFTLKNRAQEEKEKLCQQEKIPEEEDSLQNTEGKAVFELSQQSDDAKDLPAGIPEGDEKA